MSLIAFAGALAVALWPIHANGVSGSALVPRYARYWGWAGYAPLPTGRTLTIADLRRAGVRVPQDVVADRRREAAVVLVAGLAVTLAVGAAPARRATAR